MGTRANALDAGRCDAPTWAAGAAGLTLTGFRGGGSPWAGAPTEPRRPGPGPGLGLGGGQAFGPVELRASVPITPDMTKNRCALMRRRRVLLGSQELKSRFASDRRQLSPVFLRAWG